MKQLILALVAIFPSLTSCTKKADDRQGGPVITVTSPASNQTFSAGQTITISASITHSAQIHEVKIRVRNKDTGDEILEFKVDVNSSSYSISRTFIAQAGVIYKIEVEASDYSGNETETEFNILVN